MNELVKMIDTKNIMFVSKEKIGTKNSVLDLLSSNLYKNGFVKNSYIQAIKEREEKFPTGLNTTTYGIAIPHTDSIHVEEPAISIGILEEPVIFQEMGAEEVTVNVLVIFMLAIKDPSKQLDTLQAVIELLEDEKKMNNLINAREKQTVIDLLN